MNTVIRIQRFPVHHLFVPFIDEERYLWVWIVGHQYMSFDTNCGWKMTLDFFNRFHDILPSLHIELSPMHLHSDIDF